MNKTTIFIILLVVALIVIAIVAVNYYKTNQGSNVATTTETSTGLAAVGGLGSIASLFA